MRLLVLRTSAMGDVALLAPVLKGFAEKYRNVQILLVTRKPFGAFFRETGNMKLFFPDFKGRHKGFPGIFRLYRDIRDEGRIDYVIDLHDVIRTKIIRLMFRAAGTPVSVIDKGRKEKKLIVKGKLIRQLKHSVERYTEAFYRAGFNIVLPVGPWIIPSEKDIIKSMQLTGISEGVNVGIAPYARHSLKTWPEEYMISLVKTICEKHNAHVWLFGGPEESEKLLLFVKKMPGSVSLVSDMTLEEELALMTKLDFMISMDSSNMHMASLAGTRVVSIWGGTDPITGFGAWGQPEEYSIRIPVEKLSCRPCTIFGKGKCRRGDHACMVWLKPEMVYNKLLEIKLL